MLQKWKAPKMEEPEFANDPPTLEEVYQSVTDTDPWAKAERQLQEGRSMQEVLSCSHAHFIAQAYTACCAGGCHLPKPCRALHHLQRLQVSIAPPLATLQRDPPCILLLHDAASRSRIPPVQVVQREYDELFGGEVEAVHVVQDMADLNKLCKEYEKLKGKLADLIDDYTSKKRRHKKIKPQKVGEVPIVLHYCYTLVAVCTSHALT